MNADKLKKILTDHKVWLESGKQSGKKADFYYANLRNAHLVDAALDGANLNSAALNGAPSNTMRSTVACHSCQAKYTR